MFFAVFRTQHELGWQRGLIPLSPSVTIPCDDSAPSAAWAPFLKWLGFAFNRLFQCWSVLRLGKDSPRKPRPLCTTAQDILLSAHSWKLSRGQGLLPCILEEILLSLHWMSNYKPRVMSIGSILKIYHRKCVHACVWCVKCMLGIFINCIRIFVY